MRGLCVPRRRVCTQLHTVCTQLGASRWHQQQTALGHRRPPSRTAALTREVVSKTSEGGQVGRQVNMWVSWEALAWSTSLVLRVQLAFEINSAGGPGLACRGWGGWVGFKGFVDAYPWQSLLKQCTDNNTKEPSLSSSGSEMNWNTCAGILAQLRK